jgi:hypothetical protein
MAWYKCNKCGYEYNSGFTSPNFCKCPKCWEFTDQVSAIAKPLGKAAIPVIIFLVVYLIASPTGFEKMISYPAAVLDSTTLYAYSKEAYLESVIHGRRMERFFVINKTVPYYSSIVPKEKLISTRPLGEFQEKVIVELGSVIRKGEDAWIPVTFYLKEKPQQAFALFPRNWEETVTVYNWYDRVKAIRAEYETTVKENFELTEVTRKESTEFREKHNDYFRIDEMGYDTFFYAPKTQKAKLDAVYAYYLNSENINMVILQADTTWERPALELVKKTEEK